MSFSFEAAGTVDQVEMQIASTSVYGDTSQVKALRTFIAHELENWPTAQGPGQAQEPGVYVRASGHHDATSRHVNLEMRVLWLPKATEPEPVPETADTVKAAQ